MNKLSKLKALSKVVSKNLALRNKLKGRRGIPSPIVPGLGQSKIGRNEACPCGKLDANGKPIKFKKCCGRELHQ